MKHLAGTSIVKEISQEQDIKKLIHEQIEKWWLHIKKIPETDTVSKETYKEMVVAMYQIFTPNATERQAQKNAEVCPHMYN